MLGLEPVLVPLVVAMFLAGAGIEVFGLGWSLAMQENVPEEMLSRAYSYDALGSLVAMPAGQLVAGPLGEWFGLGPVLVGQRRPLRRRSACSRSPHPSVRNLERRRARGRPSHSASRLLRTDSVSGRTTSRPARGSR